MCNSIDSPQSLQVCRQSPLRITIIIEALHLLISHMPLQRAGLSPAELTAANLDKSLLFEELIRDQYGGQANSILGELQVSF